MFLFLFLLVGLSALSLLVVMFLCAYFEVRAEQAAATSRDVMMSNWAEEYRKNLPQRMEKYAKDFKEKCDRLRADIRKYDKELDRSIEERKTAHAQRMAQFAANDRALTRAETNLALLLANMVDMTIRATAHVNSISMPRTSQPPTTSRMRRSYYGRGRTSYGKRHSDYDLQ